MKTLLLFVILVYALLMVMEAQIWDSRARIRYIPECWMALSLLALVMYGQDIADVLELP